MDQTGALLGPLIMMVAVARTGHFGPAFLWLFFPAVGTLIALMSARVLNPGRDLVPKTVKAQELTSTFWVYVAAAGVLACGFLDFPLMAFHFQSKGLITQENIPLVYAGAMGINGLGALIFGRLFDRFGLNILVVGILISALSLPLAFLGDATWAVASVACWSIGLGAQDATLRAGIAKVVSMNKRGSAFGAFNGVYGVAWFAGSALMGLMYASSLTALVTFGVAMQLAAAAIFFRLRRSLWIHAD
jgi:MFS family permease